MGKPAYKKSRGYIPPRYRRRASCEICCRTTTADMLHDGLCLDCEDAQRPSNFDAAWEWARKISEKAQ